MPISDLNIGQHNDALSIKILALWVPNLKNMRKHCHMIVSDEQGERIEVTVPHPYYLMSFVKRLKEGEWCLLKDFWVMWKPNSMQNTPNQKFIKFTCITKVDDYAPKVDSEFFKFVEIRKIIRGFPGDITHPIDTYGIIIKVSRARLLPFVPNNDEIMLRPKYRDFYIVEMDGVILKCTATGECFEKFNELWDGGYHNIEVKGSTVFCVLRFWKISGLKDQPSLINNEGCSRILFDPTIPEIAEEEYIGRMTHVFYRENVPGSDGEEEAPWGPMPMHY